MNMARLFAGVLLITLGTVLALGAADVVDAGELISEWWPVALIAAGALQMVVNPRHWFSPVLVAGVGVVLLLNTTGAVDADLWPAFWAGLLVVAGVGLLVGSRMRGSGRVEAPDRIRELPRSAGGNW